MKSRFLFNAISNHFFKSPLSKEVSPLYLVSYRPVAVYGISLYANPLGQQHGTGASGLVYFGASVQAPRQTYIARISNVFLLILTHALLGTRVIRMVIMDLLVLLSLECPGYEYKEEWDKNEVNERGREHPAHNRRPNGVLGSRSGAGG